MKELEGPGGGKYAGPFKIFVSKIDFKNRLMIVNGQAFAYHSQMESTQTRILFRIFRSYEILVVQLMNGNSIQNQYLMDEIRPMHHDTQIKAKKMCGDRSYSNTPTHSRQPRKLSVPLFNDNRPEVHLVYHLRLFWPNFYWF